MQRIIDFFPSASHYGAQQYRWRKDFPLDVVACTDIQNPLAPEPGSLDVKLSESFRYTGRQGLMSEKQTRYQFFAGNYAFTTGFAFDTQGNLSQLDYPSCQHADGGCATNDPQRTVNFNYEKGMLRSVPGFANNLTYQSGGMLHQLTHGDGVVDTQEVSSSNGLARPHQLTTSAGWSTDIFSYDGAGNISAIGNLAYRYDRLGRLISGQTSVGATLFTQTASFDNFGNIQQLSTPGFSALNLNPSATTNRLGLSGAQYDAAGNLTDITIGSESFDYAFDGANMMKHLRSNTDQARVYIYNAEDERILTFDCFGPGATSTCTTQPASLTWTLRGLGNEVLRVYDQPAGGAFSWSRDYVHRGGQPLATIEPDGSGGELTSHLHLDHLGTPRQITRGGQQVALHNYYPFGQEATSAGADEIQLKFTGHERDKTGTGARSELDYMHARHCSPVVGRFLSVDPVVGATRQPQSWNRYAYVTNNPLNLVDPNGLEAKCVTTTHEDGSQDIVCGERIEVVDGTVEEVDSEEPAQGFPTLVAFIEVASLPAVTPLSTRDRILSSVPIDGMDYARCVRKNRAKPVAALVALGSGVPKRLVPPFRVPNPKQPLTNPARAFVGSPIKRAFPSSPLARRVSGRIRIGGRFVSRIATPLTLAEGYYDIAVLGACSF